MAKLCIRHQSDLLEALRRKGMSHLIDNTPANVELFKQRWLKGEATAGELNAYVVAELEIAQKAYNYVGEFTNHPNVCALCAAQKKLGEDADEVWLDNVTDAILVMAMVNGLMGTVQ